MERGMSLKEPSSEAELDKFIQASEWLVLHFQASWAEQCARMNEVLLELSKMHKKVKFLNVAAETFANHSLKYGVTAVPTIILIQGGKVVSRVDGANASEVTRKVNDLVMARVESPGSKGQVSTSLEDRLKGLINSSEVMLFMKGNKAAPQCGFSKQMIALLESIKAQYNTFDILTDNEVREGLKKYSDWPTYPQLYVKGELVGGLDIVKEMVADQSIYKLLPQLRHKQDLEARLKGLINKSDIMVFMKGSPATPKCGFSRTLIDILKSTGIKFETFDILEDDEVRQGLKELSNWPTYPQVYVRGELIGGLDIIKELQASGELLATLAS